MATEVTPAPRTKGLSGLKGLLALQRQLVKTNHNLLRDSNLFQAAITDLNGCDAMLPWRWRPETVEIEIQACRVINLIRSGLVIPLRLYGDASNITKRPESDGFNPRRDMRLGVNSWRRAQQNYRGGTTESRAGEVEHISFN